jgi:hypothetical protein
MIITHIVLLRVASNVKEDQIIKALKKLGRLQSTAITQIKSFTYGKNSSPEGLNRGYNYGFTMQFSSAADRDYYLQHQDHIDIAKNHILPLLENGAESALAFDYESF